jgi:hypothetical protein
MEQPRPRLGGPAPWFDAVHPGILVFTSIPLQDGMSCSASSESALILKMKQRRASRNKYPASICFGISTGGSADCTGLPENRTTRITRLKPASLADVPDWGSGVRISKLAGRVRLPLVSRFPGQFWQVLRFVPVIRYLPVLFALTAGGTLQVLWWRIPFRQGLLAFVSQIIGCDWPTTISCSFASRKRMHRVR